MFNRRLTTLFLLVYAALRVFSYVFGPSTPLQPPDLVNTVVCVGIIILTLFFFAKNDPRAWIIVVMEIILGGSGNYLEAFGLTLRTWLLALSVSFYFGRLIFNKQLTQFWQQEKIAIIIFSILFLIVGWGSVLGIFSNHNYKLVFRDALPYLFFLYYFPLRDLWSNTRFKNNVFNAIIAAVLGNFFLITFTFVGFSTHYFVLQDSYYHWYRDVAGGKITELGSFYRLVINEHLLLIPLLIYFASSILKKEQTRLFSILAALLLIVLSVNLTRVYLLALVIGYCFLFTKAARQRWLTVGIFGAMFFIISFTGISLAASRGASLGWELFGIRLTSFITPSVEESSLSRMLLLPKIVERIQSNSFLGSGLGETITVYSPVFKKEVTTPHFDWGYLEILAELGLLGLFVWYKTLRLVYSRVKTALKPSWELSSLLALLVINITSPALFHIFGALWLVILLNHQKN